MSKNLSVLNSSHMNENLSKIEIVEPNHILNEIRDNLASINDYVRKTLPTLQDGHVTIGHNSDTINLSTVYDEAVNLYKTRRMRSKYFDPDLLGEPAWDILLDLFIAEYQKKSISITSACIASVVPPTTALRWLNILIEAGLIQRALDKNDGRRALVALTQKGQSAMIKYLEATISQ